MRTHELTIPEIILIAGTRVALGIGIGLLLAGRMSDDGRRGAGRALFAVGALTSIPLFLAVRGRTEAAERLAA
jgi:hypothetical protein